MKREVGTERGPGNTRLYGATIAVVSGVYSIGSALGLWASPMTDDMGGVGDAGAAGWLMLAIGIAVLVHGVLLVATVADAAGRLNGPLMVVWAVIMLANQGMAAMGNGAMVAGMGVDAGMVAIAILMLASGLIMMMRPMSDERGE